MKKRMVLVEVSFRIPVDFTGWEDDSIRFDVEESSCPATHNVGSAVMAHIERYENGDKKGFCWACALGGKNKIVDMDYKEEPRP